MARLPEVIGLLYRADWTRLSLSAGLRSETDREPLPRLPRDERSRWYRAWPMQRQDNGRYAGRGMLLIGPGGRWRLECPVPGRGAGGEAAEGNDGEGGWSWRLPEVGGPPPLPVGVGAAYPPPPELFCPSCLLGGYTLEELGPVTVAGRGAIAVAATPRRDVLSSVPGRRSHDRISHDRIEVAVDAELGILLRRIETSGRAGNPHRADRRDDEPAGSGRPGPVRAAAGQQPERELGSWPAEVAHRAGWEERRRPGRGRPRRTDQVRTAPAGQRPGLPGPGGDDAVTRPGPARARGRHLAARRGARPALSQQRAPRPRRHGPGVARPGRDERAGFRGSPRRRARRRRLLSRRGGPLADRDPHGRPAARQRPRPVPPRVRRPARTGVRP